MIEIEDPRIREARASAGHAPPAPSSLDAFPLTDIQHAYWIGRSTELELGGVACHVYVEWHVEDLDLARLERAWNRVIRHHPMMRAIVQADGRQRILPKVPPYEIILEDLGGLDDAEREARLKAIRQRMTTQVLDCSHWPVFELRASRLEHRRFQIHLDLDLLLFDVQSFHILLADLERLYTTPSADLPPFALTFRDVVLARLAERQGPAHAKAWSWWLERLEDLPPPPDLPLKTNPDALKQPSFIRHQRHLEPDRWSAISRRASERGLTASAVVLAAFSEVLCAWSQNDRFTLNLTQFDRPAGNPDIARMVGDFTSTLLVTADCTADLCFEERARAVQEDMWSRLARRQVSGIEVMREIARRSTGLRGTMMPIVFTSILGLKIDDLSSSERQEALFKEPAFLHTATPQIWLDHQAMIQNGRLVYNWIVVEELFPKGMIEAMLNAYALLLDRLAGDEEHWRAPVQGLLPPAQAACRARANATASQFDLLPIHQGFFAHAKRSPGRPAVIHPDLSLTFGALLDRVEALARALHAQGVRKGDRVAVALARHPDQIAAVLAVLRQGAIYVPLPADWPLARIEAVCQNAEVRAMISHCDRLSMQGQAKVIDPRMPVDPGLLLSPPAELDLNRLAYLIYTSGSTGSPKGVMMSHGAVANTLLDINRRYAVGPNDRVLAISSLGFDLSVFDIFGLLGAGGALVLLDDRRALEPDHWHALMQSHGVTLWNSVPALLAMLLDHLETTGHALNSPLRRVLLSGDWVPLSLPGRLRALAPDARLAVLGGATEAAIWSNQFEVETLDPAWASVPYGTPLANQRYAILDNRLNDRPDWVAGDLHIAGAGLANGYWGDPARTNEQFIRHPSSAERLYRTGDRARYWPDGTIEFLGRQDHQVKINGHRIELGEIEACMARQQGVKAAIADVVDAAGLARQLAAWLVIDPKPAKSLVREQVAKGWTSPGWQRTVNAAKSAIGAIDPALAEQAKRFDAAAEELAINAMIGAFEDLAWFDPGEVDPCLCLDRSAIDRRYHRLIGQWCALLVEKGILKPLAADRYRAASSLARRLQEDDAARTLMALTAGDAGSAGLVDWILTSRQHLASMLKGEIDPLEILFPDGQLHRAESLYRDNPVTQALGAAIGSAVAAFLHLGKPTDAHILEVGAGTGGTTAYVLSALDPSSLHYTFTDLSEFFFENARERLNAPMLQFACYDINLDPSAMGLPAHAQDVVIAANVMHDARDLRRSLRHLRDLLRPGGLLVLLEATRNMPLQLVTAGLIEGFNGFADFRAEAGLPLLSAGRWQEELQRAGFSRTSSLPLDQPSGLDLGQHVILAQAPARIRYFDQDAFIKALAEELPSYMLPHSVALLDALPLSANGKVDRRQLQSRHERPLLLERLTPPATLIEQEVAAVWREVLKIDAIGRESHFFRLGGDSLLATRIAGGLKARLQRPVHLRALFENPELHAFAKALEGARAPEEEDHPWPTHLELQAGDESAEATLVFVPASDGTGYPYRQLAQHLPEDWRVIALQAPGMDERPPLDDLEALASLMAERIKALSVTGRLILGGWSFGALLAAETAWELERRDRRPDLLLLIDPPDPASPLDAAERLLDAIPDAVDFLQSILPFDAIDGETPQRLRRRFQAMVDAHLRAMRDHQPKPYTRQPVLWIAPDDPVAGGLLRLAFSADALPPESRRIVLPGDHWSLLRDEAAISGLIEALQTSIPSHSREEV